MDGDAWFVGREEGLRALGERLERSLGGSGGLVLVAGAAHLLHLQNPAGLAAGLAGFLARHPLPVSAAQRPGE